MRLSAFVRYVLLMGCLSSLSAVPARAEIVYDNSSGSSTNVYYSLLEYGDEVTLGGVGRVMTEFQFEYYGDFVASGGETARLRLYKNDGPGTDPSPGTVLFDKTFAILPGDQTESFTGLSITIPTDLTWTVQFSGLVGGNGDEAGLFFQSPPSVGSSFDDFWLKTASGWKLFSWSGNPVADFAARITSGTDAPTVAIRSALNKAVIDWVGASILQVAASAEGPYKDLPDARNHFEFDTRTAPAQFWRLRQ
jgi:hypothetical protein